MGRSRGSGGSRVRFDVENALNCAVIGYLKSTVADSTQGQAPIVGFYDPMSYTDEGSRIIVMTPDVQTAVTQTGFAATVEIGVRSQWAQTTLKADMDAHFARVNDVRSCLLAPDITAQMGTVAPSGLIIEQVRPARKYSTSAKLENWIVSFTELTIQGAIHDPAS